MNTTEKIYIWIIIFLAFSLLGSCVQNVRYADQIREQETHEIKLSDGTPCVVNKNGGIACNWRNTK